MNGPPATLLGAWRCPGARVEVNAAGERLPLDTAELTVGGAAVAHGTGPRGAACVLVGRVTDPSRLHDALGAPPPAHAADAIAAGFERFGDHVLRLLRGAWTVVLWDAERRRGLLACDPLGGRGLHYARRDGGIVFGEEARDVLALLPATPGPDRDQLVRWLLSGTYGADRTPYAGVQRLEGGTLLRLGGREAQHARWWNPAPGDLLDIGFDDAAALLRDTIDTAVRRLAHGRRAGVQLSGGLDSSTVAASALAAGEPAGLVAYSGVFAGVPEADETELLDVLVDAWQLTSVRSTVTGGRAIASGLEHLDAWRLPLTSGQTFLWDDLLRRAAADGIEVMLDGQGGDEVFAGDMLTLVADALRHGRLDRAWQITGRVPHWHAHPRRRLRVLRGLAPIAAPPGARAAYRRARGRAPAISPLARPADRAVAEAVAEYRFAWRELRAGPLWWRTLAHRLTDLRAEVDAPGMFRRRARLLGFEPGQPLLLDQDVVELALRLPGALHLDRRYSRPLARAAAAGRVPDRVRLRADKSRFSEPFVTSMLGPERELVADLLEPGGARVREFLAPDGLDAHLRWMRDGRPDVTWCQRTWRLAMAECWLRELEAPGTIAQLRAEHPPVPASITVREPAQH